MLVWLFAVLVGSVLFAAGLVAYLPRPQQNVAASVDVAAEPPRPTSKTDAEAAAPSSTETSGKTQRSDPKAPAVADKRRGGGSAKPLGVAEEPKLGVEADPPQGLYAARTQPKTSEWLAERGGTVESQKAVEDGLNWLARHQGDGGHWGSDCLGMGADSRCDQKAPCEGPGDAYDVGVSGLALLAFQAAGHYYFNGQKYSDNVAKGLGYLVEMQASDGSIVGPKNPTSEQIAAGAIFDPNFMYEHAIATFALCEACAVAIAGGKEPDPRYQTAAANAVSFIEKGQHDDGGWRYTVDPRDPSDSSVSGWVMLALKTAREAKIGVSAKTISRMMEFFTSLYTDGRTYYQPTTAGTDALTGVGMMAVVFFEHKLDSPVVKSGAAYLANNTDDHVFNLSGYYRWYNCTMAMFQVGGEPWKRWNDAIRDRVVAMQVQGEGCDRGSWPTNDVQSAWGGRNYTTALAVLTLEVYYRFQRVAGQPEEEKFFKK